MKCKPYKSFTDILILVVKIICSQKIELFWFKSVQLCQRDSAELLTWYVKCFDESSVNKSDNDNCSLTTCVLKYRLYYLFVDLFYMHLYISKHYLVFDSPLVRAEFTGMYAKGKQTFHYSRNKTDTPTRSLTIGYNATQSRKDPPTTIQRALPLDITQFCKQRDLKTYPCARRIYGALHNHKRPHVSWWVYNKLLRCMQNILSFCMSFLLKYSVCWSQA